MSEVHFGSPWWLLVPLLGLSIFFVTANNGLPGAWPDLVTRRLHEFANHWLIGNNARSARLSRWLLCLLIGAALADIRIGHTDVVPLRNLHARFLVVDVSQPENYQRQIFVARQLAARAVDIPTGVVAVAGDAYDVVPITTDISQIDRYLKVLDPAVMPEPGQRLELGLRRAQAAMNRSGITAGQIVLLTAGVAPSGTVSAISTSSATSPTSETADQADAPVWIVLTTPDAEGWNAFAGRIGAKVIDASDVAGVASEGNKLDGQIDRDRQRAIRASTPVRQRRSIAPWLALLCLPLWLLVFFRATRR